MCQAASCAYERPVAPHLLATFTTIETLPARLDRGMAVPSYFVASSPEVYRLFVGLLAA